MRIERLEDRALLTGIPIIGLELQINAEEYGDDGASQAVISGTVTGGESHTFDIEIDIDGDMTADACVPLGEGAQFTIDLGATLPFGEQTVQARVRQWSEADRDYVFGDWESLTWTNPAATDSNVSDDSPVDIALADILNNDDLYADAGEELHAYGLDEITPPDGEPEGEFLPPDPEIGPIDEEIELSTPRIENFDYVYDEDDWYIFTGLVTDCQEPEALTVYFAGGPMTGRSTEVKMDGSFEVAVQLILYDSIYVRAQARGNPVDSDTVGLWID